MMSRKDDYLSVEKHREIKLLFLTLVVSIILFSGLINKLILSWLSVNVDNFPVDAIVLMAGDMDERIPTAAKLYNEGYADKVILTNDGVFSSWSEIYNRNLYNIEWAEESLVKLGVPLRSIIKLPFRGSGTIYDAIMVNKYNNDLDFKSFVIVTSDYHARRTLWTFNYVFSKSQINISIHPTKNTKRSILLIFNEFLKYVYYMVRFGVFDMTPTVK